MILKTPKARGTHYVQSGLTLIELLVALTIGGVLIAGIITVYAGNKQTYRVEDGLSRLQENGRYAIEFLSRNIRIGGFSGCAGIGSVTPRVIADPPPPITSLAFGRTVSGYEGTGDGNIDILGDGNVIVNVQPNTDVLSISTGTSCGARVITNMASRTATIQVENTAGCGWNEGDYLMITDCQAMDVFRASGITTAGGVLTLSHAVNNGVDTRNTDPITGSSVDPVRLATSYDTNAMVFGFSYTLYFVRTDPVTGEPSLYQSTNGSVSLLVAGIENMQIRYGIDTNNDNIADIYQTASTIGGPTSSTWNTVISVELKLLLRTTGTKGNNLAMQHQTYSFNGTSYTASDKRIRREISRVMSMRNQTL